MKKCIEITMDTETGSIHVMECAPKEEMEEGGMAMMSGADEMEGAGESESGGMRDFEDVGEALRYVASLLVDQSSGAVSAAFSDGGGEATAASPMMMQGKAGM